MHRRLPRLPACAGPDEGRVVGHPGKGLAGDRSIPEVATNNNLTGADYSAEPEPSPGEPLEDRRYEEPGEGFPRRWVEQQGERDQAEDRGRRPAGEEKRLEGAAPRAALVVRLVHEDIVGHDTAGHREDDGSDGQEPLDLRSIVTLGEPDSSMRVGTISTD